jgi:hypothetical protein
VIGLRGLPGGCSLRLLEEADADELFALVEDDRAHLAPWTPWVAAQVGRDGSLAYAMLARDWAVGR